MKRAAVFAHYDKDNLIDDYVIYYLRALKSVCNKLVFVSCCELSEKEKSKLIDIADFVICEKHEEYDFGSYKRGYLCLKNNGILENIESLIFSNDSCYGPLFELEPIFTKMDDSDGDFWGITKNKFGMRRHNDKYVVCVRPHLQSYFLVFSYRVFNSNVFDHFICGVKKEKIKDDIIINYEIGLSETLVNAGFVSNEYIKAFYRFNHVILSLWRPLVVKYKMPFLKCSLIRLVNKNIATIAGWKSVITKHTAYPVELIENNQARTLVCAFNKYTLPKGIKILCFNIMAILPGILKRKASCIVKNYFPCFTD